TSEIVQGRDESDYAMCGVVTRKYIDSDADENNEFARPYCVHPQARGHPRSVLQEGYYSGRAAQAGSVSNALGSKSSGRELHYGYRLRVSPRERFGRNRSQSDL